MSEETEVDMVRCHDEVHRIWGGLKMKGLQALVVFMMFSGLGWLLGSRWPEFVGFLFAAGGIVIPQIIRIHRTYADQKCPACGERVGRYETSKSRIVLVCQHCGKRTPTDCAVHYAGGPPSKIG